MALHGWSNRDLLPSQASTSCLLLRWRERVTRYSALQSYPLPPKFADAQGSEKMIPVPYSAAKIPRFEMNYSMRIARTRINHPLGQIRSPLLSKKKVCSLVLPVVGLVQFWNAVKGSSTQRGSAASLLGCLFLGEFQPQSPHFERCGCVSHRRVLSQHEVPRGLTGRSSPSPVVFQMFSYEPWSLMAHHGPSHHEKLSPHAHYFGPHHDLLLLDFGLDLVRPPPMSPRVR